MRLPTQPTPAIARVDVEYVSQAERLLGGHGTIP